MNLQWFSQFSIKSGKVEKGRAAARPSQKLLLPMLFNRYFRPSAPGGRFYGKSAIFTNLHKNSPIFGDFHQKLVIFTHFRGFGGKIGQSKLIIGFGYVLQAQIVAPNAIPRSPLGVDFPFSHKNCFRAWRVVLRAIMISCKKCKIL